MPRFSPATPEQVQQLRLRHQNQQADYARNYNSGNVPPPGPGFYAPPFYITDNGYQYILGTGGQWVEQPFVMPSPFQMPNPGGANPTGPTRTAFPEPRQPWQSGGNNMPTVPNTPNQPNSGSGNNSWQQYLPSIISAITPFLANMGNGNGGPGGGGNNGSGVDPMLAGLLPDMQAMFRSQLARQRASDPLYQQVLQMAGRQLPMWSRGNFGALSGSSGTSAAVGPQGPLPNSGNTMPTGPSHSIGSRFQGPPAPPAGPSPMNQMVADLIARGGR